MKKRFHHEDLLYGVLLAAVVSFAFATLLDTVRLDYVAASQVQTITSVAAQSSPAVASTVQVTQAAR